MPFGFEEKARCGISYLMSEFHCSHEQIQRWRNELGIEKVIYANTPRPVKQIKDGVVIRQFKSINEAARVIKAYDSNIRNAAAGKIKSAYGFEWEYADGRD